MSQKDAGRSRTPRRSPAARPTDDHLLDAARAVFAERGYEKATMDAIAERADSTKPTLYAHFGDKEALYRAAVGREAVALGRWVTDAYTEAGTDSIDQQVRVYVMALFSYAAESPDGFRMIFQVGGPGNAGEIRAGLVDIITGRVTDQIRGYLATLGRHPGPSAELLATILVAIVGKAAEHSLRPGADPLVVGELAACFIMAALNHLDPALMDRIDHPGEPPQDR